jgi:type VI secretion system protein ImpE
MRMSTTQQTAGGLFRAGNLAAAISAANAEVRRSPADLRSRVLLAELLVFAGNIERADTILDAASQTDPSAAVVIAEFRQLLRADLARRQFSREGRVPEFLDEPTPALRAALAAQVAQRGGNLAEAAARAAEAEALRPRVPGTLDQAGGEQVGGEQAGGGIAFDDFRDLDDRYAAFIEVLTTTGKYFWVPTERIGSIRFHAPKRPRDLAWRRATISVNRGPDGEVYIPAIYDSADPDLPDRYRLGRGTDWAGEEAGLVRGTGQRVFLAGDDAYPIMEIAELRFAA